MGKSDKIGIGGDGNHTDETVKRLLYLKNLNGITDYSISDAS